MISVALSYAARAKRSGKLTRPKGQKRKGNTMKKETITLANRYIESNTCNVRVTPIETTDDYGRPSRYAKLSPNQIRKIDRELRNRPSNMNETQTDIFGRVVEAEIYFD